MTQAEFDELEAAIAALAEHDVLVAQALSRFLLLLVRALPVQAPAQEGV